MLIFTKVAVAEPSEEIPAAIINDPCSPLQIKSAQVLLTEDAQAIRKFSVAVENTSPETIVAYGLAWSARTNKGDYSIYTDVDYIWMDDRSELLKPGDDQTRKFENETSGLASPEKINERYESVSVKITFAVSDEKRTFEADIESFERLAMVLNRYFAISSIRRGFLSQYHKRGIEELIRLIAALDENAIVLNTDRRLVQMSKLDKLVHIYANPMAASNLKEGILNYQKQLSGIYRKHGEKDLIRRLEFKGHLKREREDGMFIPTKYNCESSQIPR